MRALPVATLLLLALASAGCASHRSKPLAEAPPTHAERDASFAWLDVDGNGRLSTDDLEVRHAVALMQDFDNADTNGDGQVSRAEWDAWWPSLDIAAPAPSMASLNRRIRRD
ncbi:MAG: hypothetical protein J0H15_13415 [Xanthomonadales bacterium]|nr:hypothetical protein [Xanthomonadales bacterium]